MKESHAEGLTHHGDHESCAGSRKETREALDSGIRRLGIEPRKLIIQGADIVRRYGKQHQTHRYGEMRMNLAWSETSYMRRNSIHGNREIPQLTRIDRVLARIENPQGVTR